MAIDPLKLAIGPFTIHHSARPVVEVLDIQYEAEQIRDYLWYQWRAGQKFDPAMADRISHFCAVIRNSGINYLGDTIGS